MHVRNLMYGFCLATALIAWAGRAQAQSRAAVLGIFSEEGDDDFAASVSDELRSAARDHWSVNPNNQTTGALELSLGCGFRADDPACRDRIMELLHADVLFFGYMSRDPTSSGGYTLVVTVYFYDGEHMVSDSHAFAPQAAQEEIRAYALQLMGGTSRVQEVPAAPASPNPTTVPQTAGSHDWLGWVLAGVATATFVGGIATWVRLNDLSHDPGYLEYRMRGPFVDMGNVCLGATGRAAEVCSQGSTMEILEYTLLGISVLALGTSVAVFILSRTGENSPRVSLLPSISPSRASLTLTVDF